MLTLGVLVVLTAVYSRLRGGSFESLANTRFRMSWLLFAGLGVQLAADLTAPEWLEGGGGLAVIIVTNLAVATFLFLNRTYAGTALAALGLVLNVLVISANGAMPVNPRAVKRRGHHEVARERRHQARGHGRRHRASRGSATRSACRTSGSCSASVTWSLRSGSRGSSTRACTSRGPKGATASGASGACG